MDWSTFSQQSINTASTGAAYCLLAIGITVVFGLARLVNFAHAAFGVLAGFIASDLVSGGSNFWVGLAVGVAIVASLAYGLQKAFLLRTLDDPLRGLVISLGVLIILQAWMVEEWGRDPRLVPSLFHGRWELGGAIITHQRFFNMAAAMGLVVGLLAVLQWTKFGRAVRATAEDVTAARIVGVDTNATIGAMFVLGTAMAAVSGVLLGTVMPFQPFSGNDLLIKAFAVAIIGGLGNISGAIVAAFLLATVENMGAAYWAPEWVPAYSLGFIILILLIRPSGLFKATT